MPDEDLVELKFRLYDGTDIGPIRYSAGSTVATLKEMILSEWPRDKKIIPKAANDLRLISAGKVLENSKTVGQCQAPFGELPGGVITMHVVVQPSVTKTKTVGRARDEDVVRLLHTVGRVCSVQIMRGGIIFTSYLTWGTGPGARESYEEKWERRAIVTTLLPGRPPSQAELQLGYTAIYK